MCVITDTNNQSIVFFLEHARILTMLIINIAKLINFDNDYF